MQKAKALWHVSGQNSTFRDEVIEEQGKVLVKSLYSMISLGTESLVAKGNVPKKLHEVMRVPYQEGSFDFPIKYGYSLVGEVQTGGHPLFKERVHLLHPHQDFCEVAEKDLFVIPDEVDTKTATLASNLETALTAIWDAKVSIGDKVLIVGFGLIGSLLARLLSDIPGLQLLVLDTKPGKVKLAKVMGFEAQLVNGIGNIEGADSSTVFDLAFHCSASAGGLQTCIDLTGFESKIVELSWYGDQSVNIQLGGSFHHQRKQIISSQVSQLSTDHRGRWNYQRRKETVFNLLKNPIFKHHISQTLKFASVPKFFDELRTKNQSELGICIDYN